MQQWKCGICAVPMHSKQNLANHLRNYHGIQKPFACSVCNYRGMCESSVQAHMAVHITQGREKKHMCDKCDFRTYLKGNLTRHMRTHEKIRHVCDQCDYQTDVKFNFTRHLKKHRTLYPCKMCHFKGSSHIALLRHETTHTRQDTYACHLCDYRGSHLNDLHRHILMHTESKNYACTLCDYRASQKSHLKRHLLTRHMVTLMFSKCDYKTTDENALRDHFLSHLSLQDKKYMCPLCECICDDTSNMSQHLLSHARAAPQEKEALKKENL